MESSDKEPSPSTLQALPSIVTTAPGGAWAAVAGFLPGATPRMARRTYTQEISAAMLFSVALAAIDSGVLAVYAKRTFSDSVDETTLNLCVALLGSMDALANILSFVWSSLGQGRRKIAVINALQAGVLLTISAIAVMPSTPVGLTLLVGLALAARCCWSGILTLRPTLWRGTYSRDMRASIVGRLSTIQLLVVAAMGAFLGRVLDTDRAWYAPAILASCAVGVGAILITRRIRVRRENSMLRQEREGSPPMPLWRAPFVVLQVLRTDRRYAQFMACMFVLGFANLMVNPILAITLSEQFGLGYFQSILITSTIQQGVQIVSIPAWGRFLDRSHVVRFRAIHSWFFTASGVVLVLGAALSRVELMYAGAVLLGLAYGGGAIAWHLGHVDFSPPSRTSLYMATHVTLNGVRGLLAPIAAVFLYEAVKHAGGNAGGHASAWVLGVSLIVSMIGAAGFVWLNRSMKNEMRLSGSTRPQK